MKLLKKILRKIKKIATHTISLTFYLMPIKKNKITFANFFGKGYGCNPKYLAEEFLKHGKYELIWFVSNLNDESIPAGIKKVKYGSLKHYYHLITAKLWIDNIRNNPKPLFKRKKQVYIQSWHGGLMLKGIEKDAENSLSKDYIKTAKHDGKITDYVLSNCKKRTELIKRSFWYDGEILEYGVPRDDVMFKPNEKEIAELKQKYNIENKKIVVYAPSFRRDKSFYTNLTFNPDKLVDTLNKKFNNEFVFCVRLHPNDTSITSLKGFENVINLTKEADSQLILSAADVVVSDYSSMLLDFTLTKRPAFFFAPDYDEYIKKERGLYIDLGKSGIPFSKTFDELIESVETFNSKQYVKDLDKLFDFYEVFETGDSSKLIVEHLISKGDI